MKKNKKIETVVPIIAELQVWWSDSISFEIYWDPTAYEKHDHKQIRTGDFIIPASSPFRMTFIATLAKEFKQFMERF